VDRGFADFLRRCRDEPPAEGFASLSVGGRDWLLENDFIVAEALQTLDGAITSEFLRRLPGLGNLPEASKGHPRIEIIAGELVRRDRGRLDTDEVSLFVEGYQEVQPLRLAELWALPSFLRLILLEELLEGLTDGGKSFEVGPYILAVRALAAHDWRKVVEELSRVERILRQDPTGVYPRMDFRTRDRYRGQVENISRRAGDDEERVARTALEQARSHAGRPREGHVGYYLLDEGRAELFGALGSRVPLGGTPARRRRWSGLAYFGGIALLSALTVALFAWVAGSGALSAVPVLLALIPAIGVAVGIANRAVAQFFVPHSLPRLDMRKGIPDAFRTVVSVPVLLGSRGEVRGFLQTLESNYRANPDPNLTFALISDLPDADRERTEEDDEVLAVATRGIRNLNRRYGSSGRSPFLLLHRGRRWNRVEQTWMGWERKRGKLVELSQLILGQPSSLWVAEGEARRLEGTPFVLTLDADTRLPQHAAARLVGTLAHPLNRPEVGGGGRILRGYSVLQPRLEPIPEPDGGTLFSRVYGGVQGLDLYSRAAFDVYQDLFDVGIFAGKGIFDVKAFEASLAGRTPENAILSHDLFEGAHGRAGLVSDLTLLEEFPGHPLTHARRAHRWTRGDWQLLPWLFPRVPGADGTRIENRISPLGRWMILDNLRRSLQPPAILLSLLAGWAVLPPVEATLWTVLLVSIVGLPFLTGTVDAALRILRAMPRWPDLEVEARALARALARWGIELAFLPFEAWTSADAIVRTIYRVYVSRAGLLEWTSAALTARRVQRRDTLGTLHRSMWPGPVVAVAGTGGLLFMPTPFPAAAIPLLSLWFASGLVGQVVRRSHRPIREPRGVFPRRAARSLARRTWGYYEAFQGPEGNWMAPDHFQESPGGEVARRTSPTNLGMGLVAVVTAWDLGFVGTSRLIARVRGNVEGMQRLPRYRGHFYNWYDTISCEPLNPRYISTVDSGNLAAGFLSTREALRDARSRPLWTRDQVEGILDTVRVVGEILEEAWGSGTAQALLQEARELEGWVERHLFDAWDAGLPRFVLAMEELRDARIPVFDEAFLRLQGPVSEPDHVERWDAVHAWASHLRGDVERALDELLVLLPWLRAEYRGSDAAQALNARILPTDSGVPSLRGLRVLLARELPRETASTGETESDPDPGHLDPLERAIEEAHDTVQLLLGDLSELISELDTWTEEMDFSFLYDEQRELFRIGLSVTEGELDPNHYDLLASEARLASAITMSVGDAPPTHWMHLGRPFKWTRRGTVLLSWAGTMFEYLMPLIFMRCPPESVLEDACRRAVAVQRDHGRKLGIPWGVSESGYHVLSPEGHYQYRAFGVPLLGLRRTGGTRQVVAPYASIMAVSLAPGAAFRNLKEITALGGMGPWGPYEALDFGTDAEWRGTPRVVRSYMSHHHGMLLAALGNHLTENRLVERFHRDPGIRAIEPYLFERIPWRRPVEREWVDRTVPVKLGGAGPGIRRWSPPADRTPPPSHHLASRKLVVAMGPDGRGEAAGVTGPSYGGGSGPGHPQGDRTSSSWTGKRTRAGAPSRARERPAPRSPSSCSRPTGPSSSGRRRGSGFGWTSSSLRTGDPRSAGSSWPTSRRAPGG
jgi:cyclic beta-1,2-glucan synthetase